MQKLFKNLLCFVLFVAALVLGAATLWDLVKVVTLFTIAHSITLTLAALGLNKRLELRDN